MIWDYIGDILRLMVLGGLGVAGILAILIWKKNLSTRVTLLRLVIQAVAFAAIFYMFSYSVIFPCSTCSSIIFAMTLFLGRFYCGWLCPFGLIMDLEAFVRKALKIRHRPLPDKLNIALHKFKICHTAVLFCCCPSLSMVAGSASQLWFRR